MESKEPTEGGTYRSAIPTSVPPSTPKQQPRNVLWVIPNTPLSKFTGESKGRGDSQHTITKCSSALQVPTARLRRTIPGDAITEQRRELVLMIAQEIFEDTDRLPVALLPRHGEVLASDIISSLDSLLIGLPAKSGESGAEEPFYHLDSMKYLTFNNLLLSYLNRADPILRRKRLPAPDRPRWGPNDEPLELWSANDFEILAVLYREEIENLLGYLFNNHALVPSKREGQGGLPESEGRFSVRSLREEIPSLPQDVEEDPFYTPSGTMHKDPEGFESTRRGISEQQYGYRPESERTGVYASHPTKISRSKRLTELFSELPEEDLPSHGLRAPSDASRRSRQTERPYQSQRPFNRAFDLTNQEARDRGNGNPPSDSSSSDDEESRRPPPRNRPSRRLPRQPDQQRDPRDGRERAFFEVQLKHDVIPKWDGNPDTLARWINKINTLGERSERAYVQLGELVPSRLEGDADLWFWSLSARDRRRACTDWGTLRDAISSFYMNRSWLDKQKSRANKAHYREAGHTHETPFNYFIRKKELLSLVYTMSDSEVIMEIMNNAPKFWTTIVDPHRCKDLSEFAAAIKYHEESLCEEVFSRDGSSIDRRVKILENLIRDQRNSTSRYNTGWNSNRNPTSNSSSQYKPARSNLIGSSPNLITPPFPKDDSVVSKGKTPAMKGARPCRHCGSSKHWDNECRYARKGIKQARANLVLFSEEDHRAQQEYEEAYMSSSSDEEECSELTQDTGKILDENTSQFGEVNVCAMRVSAKCTEPSVEASCRLGGLSNLSQDKLSSMLRRNWDVALGETNRLVNNVSGFIQNLIRLPRIMSRPSGCSFLGAKATSTRAWLGNYGKDSLEIIIDSGADITLISQDALQQLQFKPKIRTGQKINLIQVTGFSSITGYVSLPLYFDTDKGPVEIEVDAYVVQGMTTPFILGNDFSDQYAISIIRSEDGAYLEFGGSGRKISVNTSVTGSPTDRTGRVFSVMKSSRPSTSKFSSGIGRNSNSDGSVRSVEDVIVPPESIRSIKISFSLPKGTQSAYIEKIMLSNRGEEDWYGIPDSLITKDRLTLPISNFSRFPVHIHAGQIIGYVHNPSSWLNRPEDLSEERLRKITAHALLVKSIASQLSNQGSIPSEDGEGQAELSGGPKTAEGPPEDVPSDKLWEELDINKELSTDQLARLRRVIENNKLAFGLDGRLGHYPAKVEIPLREGTKEISMAPFIASPVNRKIMDEQMDKWISLKVIEPSQSPWGAPAFIAYRNGKPRMVIDFRKLNAQVIPDEFPLPRQDDILQALSGSQWLSTLDALAGLTQLEIAQKDKEKTAFRTHRGLYQFLRLPFGFRNGPAIFQRVMQNILAPYLWIFALVYIDDIVIFSKSFEAHISHIEAVLGAIIKSKITLSPSKCHFGYQSLMLLGQKVSRLGLSTHKEKIEAITKLAEPKTVKELQTFLGMMVYF